jgi:hypothetical protein
MAGEAVTLFFDQTKASRRLKLYYPTKSTINTCLNLQS